MKHLRLAFYGDDFTGSTDAMEMLATRGYRTVLFLEPPNPEELKRNYPDVDCIGIAGISRSLPSGKLEEELAPIFEQLLAYQPSVIHYKVCSTFDSAPEIGSIGRVIDIGKRMFSNQQVIPVLAGAPPLSRYTVFGQHFAAAGGTIHRLDRHPIMSVHPATPMDEADLRLHLGRQTELPVGLMSVLELEGDEEEVWQTFSGKEEPVVLFDSLGRRDTLASGKLLWVMAQAADTPLFVVGSSGVEFALAEVWQSTSGLKRELPDYTANHVIAEAAEPIVVLSGSASDTTRRQIEVAEQEGFISVRLPLPEFLNPDTAEAAMEKLLGSADEALQNGCDIIFYTAKGPKDPAISAMKEKLAAAGILPDMSGQLLGQLLGRIMKEIIMRSRTRRFVVAGGDTSGFATKELGISAMEIAVPVAPGAPLNLCYSSDSLVNGLELALKGGQLGQEDYFLRVKKQMVTQEQIKRRDND
ncbi:four-carbon acid sugar kinase family protein [Paenibacillus riograndensis]|uniref:Hrp-dependent type III effector protein n=1 Tax=Paenibacillus riograndensis SBR5 TaxID=1073571 RepID=A0A0E4HAG5_9BACL|nr:four-carbon acid sugar kinase family protein [Paenibacillus riograndensis]CQR55934.1 Hrp-dependent type III effector protein [Paenibacillus riograndensis SBR5]